MTVPGSYADRPLRVMFVIGALTRGGSERQMVNLAIGLRRRGHQVCIVLTRAAGDLDAEVLAGGVELNRLYERKGTGPLTLIRLARAVRMWRADIVHPYLPRDNALVTLIKPFLRGAKLVWGVRASNVDLTKYSRSTRILWPFVVRASRFADLIIANSYAGARYHIEAGYPEHKMVVIPNGIDTERFRPDAELGLRFRGECGIPPDVPVVGMLGRFDPMKGHDEFPAIFARVHQDMPDARALVVGLHTEEQGRQFRQRCSDLGIADRVVLMQQTSSPEAMLNAIDVLALPSLSEGFPNVVAEAMACGKPCVAYDVGDVAQIAPNELFLAAQRDDATFASATRRVLMERPSAEESRRKITERFGSEVSAIKSEELLSDMVPWGGRR